MKKSKTPFAARLVATAAVFLLAAALPAAAKPVAIVALGDSLAALPLQSLIDAFVAALS